MDIDQIANYAIWFMGMLLSIVILYYLLRSLVHAIALLVKRIVDLLKILFRVLHFLIFIVLIAGGLQVILSAIPSLPNHELFGTEWIIAGGSSVILGSLGLTKWIRIRLKHRRQEVSTSVSSAEDPSFANSYIGYDIEEKRNETAEQAELDRQIQLMKDQKAEREQAYQNWIAEEKMKEKLQQGQAESGEFKRRYGDRHL